MDKVTRPWPALWALVIGFFMILIDTTIVSVANPAIMKGLNLGNDYDTVIWVTSAYLLAYAVPLLITGRLGDRFGPKNLYLAGLVLFTLASAWCGFSGTIEMLIIARVFQGLGAALMTPQTMAVITRIFPPDRRGQAMGLWGAVAGVATLVGPILGGVLVDAFGWEWIFFINVPIGVVAFIMAWRLVPKLETHPHRFDILGVILSAVGMFLLVFGIQEGEKYNWGTIAGPISVWSLIIAGIVVLIGFVVWQRFNKGEPLLPLKLFRDRNFSLANGAITTVGFAVTSMSLPLVFFFQIVLGFTPTQSALMLVPMAVFSGGLAPLTGKLVDIINPRYIACFGLLLFGIALFWYAAWLDPNPDLWPRLLIPSAVLGIAMSSVWSPITTTATYNLPQAQAGAGAGVFNTTRQVGAVLGSAAIAALIQGRLTAELPSGANVSTSGAAQSGALPQFLHAGFTNAMAQTLLLPASVAILGAIIVIFFEKRKKNSAWGTARTAEGARNDAAAAAAADTAGARDAAPVPVGAGVDAVGSASAGAGVDAVGSASAGAAADSSGSHGSHAAPIEPDRLPESAESHDGHGAHGSHGAHAAPAPHGAHAAPVDPE